MPRSHAVPPEAPEQEWGFGDQASSELSSAAEFRDVRCWRVFVDHLLIEPLSENEFAVYNGDFWDSSLLNSVDACLLRYLVSARDAVPEETLVSKVADSFGVPVDEDLIRYCRLSLSQMGTLGLICQGDHD